MNASKLVYLTILIVLLLNTQKHLVVNSDFCMFQGKIIVEHVEMIPSTSDKPPWFQEEIS